MALLSEELGFVDADAFQTTRLTIAPFRHENAPRRDVQRSATPPPANNLSTIQVMHHPRPGVLISWSEWVPTNFDLAAAIASAKALPSCASFSPPLTPSPTTPVKP